MNDPMNDVSKMLMGNASKRFALPLDEEYEKKQLVELLTERLAATLTPREQQVIECRFGLGQHGELTLKDTGKLMALSRERIRQIENKALRKMRSASSYANDANYQRLLMEHGWVAAPKKPTPERDLNKEITTIRSILDHARLSTDRRCALVEQYHSLLEERKRVLALKKKAELANKPKKMKWIGPTRAPTRWDEFTIFVERRELKNEMV